MNGSHRHVPRRPASTRLALLAGLSVVAVAAPPVAAQIEVTGATITELQEAMTEGRATSADITEAYLARIRAYDQAGPAINAMIWMNPDALSEARARDQERASTGARGPLHGIPIILKDNYDTYDMPTSAGTLALAGNVAPDDAFQVVRLREAGAVILGKSNMHELASGITTIGSLGGQTRNPYDLRRNPGGSSGGTGAAIAASFAAVGWGSDTCGAIRIPAAQNDLVGLRPTTGLSSRAGLIPRSPTQDVGGPLARTVSDLAIALDATVGFDPADEATRIMEGRDPPRFVENLNPDALTGARIGVLTDLFGDAPEEGAARRIVREALGRMVELGADTLAVEIPRYDSLVSGSGVIHHEFKYDLIEYLEGVPDAPVASLEEMLELGLIHEALTPRMRARDQAEAKFTDEYRTALALREPLREAVVSTLDRYQVDALAFPTVRTIPSVIGDPQRGSSCSLSANTGLPSISVPVGFTASGLPIGMELVGRPLDDARLVAIAYAWEQATDHRREPYSTPPLVDGMAPPPSVFTVRADGSGYDEPRAGEATLDGRLELDRPRGELRYDLVVRGADPADVYAVVLRHPTEGDAWLVARRISGPGVVDPAGVLVVGRGLVERIDAGEVVIELFTRADPFGAAKATIRFEDGR